MRTEIFYDFIPYWDDSTETETDHQHDTTEPTETENFELPF
jgi:hypothetical protein